MPRHPVCDGYRVNALDYLLKPVSYAEFMRAVVKAMEWHALSNSTVPTAITVRSEYRLIQLRLDSISYIEVKGDRVIFYRVNDAPPVSTLMSMRDLEPMLPSASFMRVHRSFIVNLDKVEVIERGRIVYGQQYVPVSENRREEFLRRVRSR